MELPHPIQNHRERKLRKHVLENAGRVGAEIIDHLQECEDMELCASVDPPPYRRIIESDQEYVTSIATIALAHVNTAPAYKDRLVFNARGTLDRNIETVRLGKYNEGWRHQPAQALSIVFGPANDISVQDSALTHN